MRESGAGEEGVQSSVHGHSGGGGRGMKYTGGGGVGVGGVVWCGVSGVVVVMGEREEHARGG